MTCIRDGPLVQRLAQQTFTLLTPVQLRHGSLVMKHSWAIYGRFCGLTAATGGSIPPLGA